MTNLILLAAFAVLVYIEHRREQRWRKDNPNKSYRRHTRIHLPHHMRASHFINRCLHF